MRRIHSPSALGLVTAQGIESDVHVGMDSLEEEDHELVFIDPAKRRRTRARSCGIYCLLAALVTALVVIAGQAISLGVIVGTWDCSTESETAECKTESCMELAKMVRANLDTTVNPCEDFYNFSCGGWVRGHSLPTGYPSYSPFRELDAENQRKLIYVMESDRDDDIEAVVKAKTLYHSCMNTAQLDALGRGPILRLINTSGGWDLVNVSSDDDWWSGSGSGSGSGSPSMDFFDSDIFFLQKLAGNPAFFSYYVYVDDKNSSQYTLFLEQSGLSLPSPESYTDPKSGEEQMGILKTYIVNVLSLINPDASLLERYRMAANNIVELEKNLSSVFVPVEDLRDPEATYNKMTVDNLTLKFPNTFNWSALLTTSFLLAQASEISDEDMVVVRTTSYFQNLSSILASTDSTTLYDYTMWQWVKGYVGFLSSDFREEYYNFTEHITGSGERERNLTCLSLVQSVLPIALARPFTEFYFPSNAKSSVTDMITQIKEAFKVRLDDKTWIDNDTREQCKEKVDAITQRVAYPDKIFHDSYLNGLYENYTIQEMFLLYTMVELEFTIFSENLRHLGGPVDKTEWDIAPTAVNAYYNPSFNQFTFLEGILASPFFQADWPDYFRYGAFGVIIGHELTHGFDDQGQQYDKDGNLRQWWSQTSTDNFKERQKCFREQYSRYEVFGYPVNGDLTLGENLADNGGIKTSYQAYRKVIGENGNQPYLPDLKYTPDQLFFIGFSQVWCSIFTPEYISTLVKTNPHSPGPYRVIGALVNSQEFADAFQCSSSSYMNPQSKCLMW